MTKVKLCGLSRSEDIEAVNKLMPEYVGFVFWPKSKRYIDSTTAHSLKDLLNKDIKSVGVFLDASKDDIADIVNAGTIDLIQLHGSEDDVFIRDLRLLCDKPIIKAFKLTPDSDIDLINNCSADYIMLDSGTGSGRTFDWQLLSKINRPYFLAGGLNIDNVSEAVSTLSPFAVDVSSGIESDGIKDPTKMKTFVDIVRRGK